jgi:hypothetical protein
MDWNWLIGGDPPKSVFRESIKLAVGVVFFGGMAILFLGNPEVPWWATAGAVFMAVMALVVQTRRIRQVAGTRFSAAVVVVLIALMAALAWQHHRAARPFNPFDDIDIPVEPPRANQFDGMVPPDDSPAATSPANPFAGPRPCAPEDATPGAPSSANPSTARALGCPYAEAPRAAE